ncbi:MAG TPA: hypothetical protein VHC39_16320 [Rhizomicrobium sp.]|nr:hypothetical protein [Rhizomicrobium sp.]
MIIARLFYPGTLARAAACNKTRLYPGHNGAGKPLALAIAMLAFLGLAACSLSQKIALYNDADTPLTVRIAGKLISIAPGQSAAFAYPQSSENWTLLISDTACEYLYQLPRSLDHYPWKAIKAYDDPIMAQVERDHAVYLLPPSADGVADVSALTSGQVDGFPLRPVSRTCH